MKNLGPLSDKNFWIFFAILVVAATILKEINFDMIYKIVLYIIVVLIASITFPPKRWGE